MVVADWRAPDWLAMRTGNSPTDWVIIQCALIFALSAGLCGLMFAEKIQAFYVKTYMKWIPWIPNPYLDWMKGSGYIWMIRIISGLAIVMVLVSELVILISQK